MWRIAAIAMLSACPCLGTSVGFMATKLTHDVEKTANIISGDAGSELEVAFGDDHPHNINTPAQNKEYAKEKAARDAQQDQIRARQEAQTKKAKDDWAAAQASSAAFNEEQAKQRREKQIADLKAGGGREGADKIKNQEKEIADLKAKVAEKDKIIYGDTSSENADERPADAPDQENHETGENGSKTIRSTYGNLKIRTVDDGEKEPVEEADETQEKPKETDAEETEKNEKPKEADAEESDENEKEHEAAETDSEVVHQEVTDVSVKEKEAPAPKPDVLEEEPLVSDSGEHSEDSPIKEIDDTKEADAKATDEVQEEPQKVDTVSEVAQKEVADADVKEVPEAVVVEKDEAHVVSGSEEQSEESPNEQENPAGFGSWFR